MHVGVKFGLTTGREAAELARKAEELGYHSIWLSERVAVPLDKPHPYEPSIDPWIGLAFIAAATERLFLGTTVSQIALRDPVLMARELATLDILSRRPGDRRRWRGLGGGGVRRHRRRLQDAGQAPDRVRAGAEAALDGAGRGLGRQVLSRASRLAWSSRTRRAARRSIWAQAVRRGCAESPVKATASSPSRYPWTLFPAFVSRSWTSALNSARQTRSRSGCRSSRPRRWSRPGTSPNATGQPESMASFSPRPGRARPASRPTTRSRALIEAAAG